MIGELILRADATTALGTGHVMRCLALAQAWQDAGGHAVFVIAAGSPALENRLRAEGCEVLTLCTEPGSDDDAAHTATLAAQRRAAWLAVDGLHFGGNYQRALKQSGLRVLAIDDGGTAGDYHADVVLNQNLSADERLYARRQPTTRLLLGPAYALLRREFLSFAAIERRVPEVAEHVLVTLGGSDPHNMTLSVVRALQKSAGRPLEVVVVVGSANPHAPAIEDAAAASADAMRVIRNAPNMPELMAWADLAISSGGTTVWELAFMGVPSLVGLIAPIEEQAAVGLESHRLFRVIGWFDRLPSDELAAIIAAYAEDRDARLEVSTRARQIVDGKGRQRTMDAMLHD